MPASSTIFLTHHSWSRQAVAIPLKMLDKLYHESVIDVHRVGALSICVPRPFEAGDLAETKREGGPQPIDQPEIVLR